MKALPLIAVGAAGLLLFTFSGSSAQASDKPYDQMSKGELVALLKKKDAQAAACKVKAKDVKYDLKSVTEVEQLSPFGAVVFAGLDMFTGAYNSYWQPNFGAKIGGNMGYLLLPDEGLGAQLGASTGLYDWNGNSSGDHNSSLQHQEFVTTGLFYRGPVDSRFRAGVVYDAMFGQHFGEDQANIFLNQIRWQAGAAVYGKHEVGLLGAQALNTATENSYDKYRAISHASLYYRYPFENGAEVMVWGGVPYEKGSLANEGHRAGSFLSGLRVTVPISGNFSMYAEGAYMASSRETGDLSAQQNVETVAMGFSYGFGGKPNTEGRNMPLIPVANNGTFMVDANHYH